MTVIERRLRKLSEWLKESPSNVDSHHDGHLESAIKYANQQVKQEIGVFWGPAPTCTCRKKSDSLSDQPCPGPGVFFYQFDY